MPRDLAQTPLFHITDVANLASVAAGGLLSDVRLAQSGGPQVTIGYGNIKHRRMYETRVGCAGNRFVGEFVPFYFCPRSVMLYTVNKGNTGRPAGCQRTILHLVTSVAKAVGTGRAWAYSDGNAGTAYPSFYDDINGLDTHLNWQAIQERDNWSPVKTQKAAEFLVADSFEWSSILLIGCYNQAAADAAGAVVAGLQHRPPVWIRTEWYYR